MCFAAAGAWLFVIPNSNTMRLGLVAAGLEDRTIGFARIQCCRYVFEFVAAGAVDRRSVVPIHTAIHSTGDVSGQTASGANMVKSSSHGM